MENQEEIKLAIIERSLELMYIKGYSGTSVKEIADAAGIPFGSFYIYFKSKEDYAVEAINRYSEVICKSVNQILYDKSYSPIVRLDILFSSIIDHFTKKEKFRKGCFASNICSEMGDISRPIGNAADKYYKTLTKSFHECLLEAQEKGEISSSHNVEQLSEFIIIGLEGSLIRMKVSKNENSMKIFKHMILDFLQNSS